MTTIPGSDAPPRTARQILVDWANGQDDWVKVLVAEVVLANREVSEETLASAYEALLIEKNLKGGERGPTPNISDEGTGEVGAEKLLLRRLSEVSNVNALAAGQVIDFNPRMTVLFGENAAGKTGYVRVLKRVAAVRVAEDILPNVTTRSSGKPHAKLAYELGAVGTELNWKDELGVPPLNRISVFDSRSVALHVDEDLTYTYTPRDLALFQYVHQAIEAVRNRLDSERTEAAPKANPFLTRFARGTTAYSKVEALGVTTDLAELATLGTLSSEESQEIPRLREQAAALQSEAVASRLEIARSDGQLYTALLALVGSLRRFTATAYNAAVVAVSDATEVHERSTTSAFSAYDIPGGLTDTWRRFIQAGEEYVRDANLEPYPNADSDCLYCRQRLTGAALELVTKYREYSNNQSRQVLDAARRELEGRSRPLIQLNTASLRQQLTAKETAAANGGGGDGPKLGLELLAAVEVVAAGVERQKEIAYGPVEALLPTVETLAQTERDGAEAVVTALTAQAEERARVLAEVTTNLAEREARATLRELMPEIRTYVDRAKWAHNAGTIVSTRIPPVLRALTEASKQASEGLMNQDFEKLFEQERVALRAPAVKLDFPGRRGEPARRKRTADRKLSEVLSEGEQKVIALADFLAESSLRSASAPIVFDDPVTSLDYRRLSYVVSRIVQLSESQQIIVFTHNIWFTMEILEAFAKRDECTYYDVSDTDDGKGVVTHGTNPRWDTVRYLSNRINNTVGEADRASGETLSALIEHGYELVRSWCEVVVEQELLAGVTQRYQPNVAMTKLPKVKGAALEPATAVIYPIFEKACRVMTGHSQPLETLGARPSLADLRGDWNALQAARDAYLAA